MDKKVFNICYNAAITVLSIAILLLVFLISVTGAPDWVFTTLGWISLVSGCTALVLFIIKHVKG